MPRFVRRTLKSTLTLIPGIVLGVALVVTCSSDSAFLPFGDGTGDVGVDVGIDAGSDAFAEGVVSSCAQWEVRWFDGPGTVGPTASAPAGWEPIAAPGVILLRRCAD